MEALEPEYILARITYVSLKYREQLTPLSLRAERSNLIAVRPDVAAQLTE